MSSLSHPTNDRISDHEPGAEAPFDTFARDRLPPLKLWPELLFEDPRYRFQGPLNAAVELVDRHVAQGRGEHPCLIDAASGECTTFRQLFSSASIGSPAS